MRRLIVNCDDFGSCLAANDAVEAALERGIATSATLMVPCPWAYDAALRARAHPNWAVGVHLTLTSEWARLRWRPVAGAAAVPGLADPDGFLWRHTPDVHAHARPEEAWEECRAQIEQFFTWGLAPTHLDSHMGTLQTHPAFFAVYLDLATHYNLPVRMAGPREMALLGWGEARAGAAARGVRFADDLILPERRAPGEDTRAFLLRTVRELPAGTGEVFFHPAADTPELHAMTNGGAERVADLRLLTADPEVRGAITATGVALVSYRDI